MYQTHIKESVVFVGGSGNSSNPHTKQKKDRCTPEFGDVYFIPKLYVDTSTGRRSIKNRKIGTMMAKAFWFSYARVATECDTISQFQKF